LSYLLDTNVVSETIRRQQNKLIIRWLDQIPAEALFVSVLTLGELRKGIERLTDKKRREKLPLWLEHELTA
jgi:predicted nucleic acid-binding protein